MNKETFEYAKALDRRIKALEHKRRQLRNVEYSRIILLTGFDAPIEVEPDYRTFVDVSQVILDEMEEKIKALRRELEIVLGKEKRNDIGSDNRTV